MKDFDSTRHALVARDRTFRIGGQEFESAAALPADLIANYYDAMDAPTGVQGHVLAAMDAVIECSLGGEGSDQVARWRDARRVDAADPLSIIDVEAIMRHVLEVATARPTVSSSVSGSGSERTTTPSTELSPSEALI